RTTAPGNPQHLCAGEDDGNGARRYDDGLELLPLAKDAQFVHLGNEARRYPLAGESVGLRLDLDHRETRLELGGEDVAAALVPVDAALVLLVRIASVRKAHPAERDQVPQERLADVLAPESAVGVEGGDPAGLARSHRLDERGGQGHRFWLQVLSAFAIRSRCCSRF